VRHSIEWQEQQVNAAPEERASVGDLRLFLNDQNVTMHLVGKKVADHVTVALYGLVNGILHDWWAIFGGRDREFSLRWYRTGYLLPDIRIGFDGVAFEVSARQFSYFDPDIRFWAGNQEILTREHAERWLSALINETLARLNQKEIKNTSAHLRWKRIQSSLESDERIFCESAGAIGLDPYDISESAASFIEKSEEIFGSEALVEFMSGSRGVDRERLIQWVQKMVSDRAPDRRLAELRPIVDKIEAQIPSHLGAPAWAEGYRRARAMRQVLGLEQSYKLSSYGELASLLGGDGEFSLAPEVDGIQALRHEEPDGIYVHLRDHGDHRRVSATHLFAFTRAVGDAVCFSGRETAPINRLIRAYRQAAGRAFAAEFLAPIDEINSMREDSFDEYSIAHHFGVSTQVIAHQIENESRILSVQSL
jgi:hypothetical protein